MQFSIFHNENIYCDPSFDQFCKVGSSEVSQHTCMFLCRNMENYPNSSFLSLLIWSAVLYHLELSQ